jgi:hypothetical protein
MTVLTTALDVVPGSDFVMDVTRYTGQQLLTLSGGATGGDFTLAYRGASTAAIAYNASAATVQAALEALGTLGPGNVTASGSAGGPWTVTPQGTISPDEFKSHPMTANLTDLTGGSAYHLAVSLPTLDVSTGYVYEFQARDVAGETTPDVQIDASHTSQGGIDLAGGAAGLIVVTINKATTGGFTFAQASNTILNFVLMETHSSVRSPLVEGQLRVKGKWFV